MKGRREQQRGGVYLVDAVNLFYSRRWYFLVRWLMFFFLSVMFFSIGDAVRSGSRSVGRSGCDGEGEKGEERELKVGGLGQSVGGSEGETGGSE